ncbi:Hypothetical predicted protein [Marmota monax]|uniref:Ig-like domain-containing protein n=1 Tax=Marmota monax TaxID=9995 RepID=A0A5E4AS86_MARMO|nr:hypothetical protein GHT09_000234 [Marmota monax]VTJ59519.1 Hypothetical predicted protein [Marmota monax]
MDSSLLCWVIFGLLGTAHMEPGVRQAPSHAVTEAGQDVALTCDPVAGQASLYWYRQTPGQGLEILVSFYNKQPSGKADFFRDRFSAERPEGALSTLKIQPTQLGDSATYLCSCSLGTAPQRHFLPLQKLQGFCPSSQQPSCLRRSICAQSVLHVCLCQPQPQHSTGISLQKQQSQERGGSAPCLLHQAVVHP